MDTTNLIVSIRQELEQLEKRRHELLAKLRNLEKSDSSQEADNPCVVTNQSKAIDKIHLFRSLFKGREDVFPRRFESKRSGKSGYQPACENEWIQGVCSKPKIKCADCEQRKFLPVTDDVIRNHLLGYDPVDPARSDFTIGVYPLLTDETCNFLAIDFDKSTWQGDTRAYIETCWGVQDLA